MTLIEAASCEPGGQPSGLSRHPDGWAAARCAGDIGASRSLPITSLAAYTELTALASLAALRVIAALVGAGGMCEQHGHVDGVGLPPSVAAIFRLLKPCGIRRKLCEDDGRRRTQIDP